MSDIGQKMASGAVWMVLFKIVERGIGLLSTIVLARLLIPADFGLVALAMAVIAALEVLGAFSFDVMLIQSRHAQDRTYYDTAWTLNVMFGVTATLALLSLARPVASFYDEPRLVMVVCVLALLPLASSFENIGTVAFRKEMQFQREFKFLAAKKIVAFAVTMAMAFTFRNYWALVTGALVSRIAGVALSYALHSFRPKLSLARRDELFNFSKWLFVNNLVNFFNARAPDFIIGKIGGTSMLGVYSIAYEVSNFPTTELVSPINRAVFSGYARISHDLAALREQYLSVLGVIALVAAPMALGIGASAPVFVPLVLGDKWLQAVPIIEILAWYGLAHALQSNTGSAFLAIGKPRTCTLIAMGYNFALFPALVAGSMMAGLTGATLAMVSCAVLVAPVNARFIAKYLNLRFSEILSVVWRPLVAGGAMQLLLWLVRDWFASQSQGALDLSIELITVIVTGAVTYIVVLLALWRVCGSPDGAESAAARYVKTKLDAWRSRLRLAN